MTASDTLYIHSFWACKSFVICCKASTGSDIFRLNWQAFWLFSERVFFDKNLTPWFSKFFWLEKSQSSTGKCLSVVSRSLILNKHESVLSYLTMLLHELYAYQWQKQIDKLMRYFGHVAVVFNESENHKVYMCIWKFMIEISSRWRGLTFFFLQIMIQ